LTLGAARDSVRAMKRSLVRTATIGLLLSAGLLLQGCIVASAAGAAVGAAADVGVAAAKTTVAVGKAVIP
jgi:hypothetical protein